MSQSIASLDLVSGAASFSKVSMNNGVNQQENSGFARLMVASKNARQEADAGSSGDSAGKNLPDTAASPVAERQIDDAVTGQVSSAAEDQSQAELPVDETGAVAVMPLLETVNDGQEAEAQLPDTTAEAVESTAGDSAAATDIAAAAALATPVAATTEATRAGENHSADAASGRSPVNAASAHPVAQDAAIADGLQQPGGQAVHRNHPVHDVAANTVNADDTVAQSVRNGLMKMLQGQDLHGGHQQSASGERFAALSALKSSDSTGAVHSAGDAGFASLLVDGAGAQTSPRIAPAVGQPGWGQAVGEQVMWFVSRNINSASMRLNPQHLGPMEMQVHMDGDKASIAFTSQHVMVRDALESSLPRLREMFSSSGINLVDVNISQQHGSPNGGGSSAAFRPGRNGLAGNAASAGGDVQPAAMLSETAQAIGLVDYYV